MVVPLPPTVHGPLTPSSSAVRVTGVVAGASVEVLDGGSMVGSQVATSNGEVWVGVGGLSVGALVAAQQTTGDGTSATSPSVPVVPVPSPVPVPVFVSAVTTGMSAVRLAGLVPGAHVELENDGISVGQGSTQDTTAWVTIDGNASLVTGTPLEARQHVRGDSSEWVKSLPLVEVGRESPLQAPAMAQPVTACETSISVSGTAPSADLTIDNEGRFSTWYSPASAYVAWGAPPFTPGKILARQAFPRLGIEGPETGIPVGPAVTPPAPVVQGDICPKVARVKVSNLSPGGLLTVYVRAPDPGNPGTVVEHALGVAGITNAEETFTLPPGYAAGGAVALVATQTRCDLVSPRSAAAGFVAPGGPYMAPIIAGPLYDCSRVIVLQSARVGSLVEARSAASDRPLGDPLLVSAPTVVYRLWSPLVEDDEVFVRQTGCNADQDSATDRVLPLDDPFPTPEIGQPVRPGAPVVYAKGFLRGARGHLLVDGVVRSSVDTHYADAWIPSGVPLLAEGDRLTVVQTLCGGISPIEQRGVEVVRGRLDVTLSPSGPVTRGTTTQLTVSATDRDTGAAVAGAQVLLNGSVVGSTNTPFAFSPAMGAAAANGVVRSPVQYHDAPFSVPLQNPQPTTATVHFNVAPVVAVPGALVMTSAVWSVTTQWGTNQTYTATGSSISLTLPKPPGGSGHLVISLATTWEVAGYVLGSAFEHASFQGLMFPSPTTVVWNGAGATVGFWALPQVSDAGDGTPLLQVVTQYQGIQ